MLTRRVIPRTVAMLAGVGLLAAGCSAATPKAAPPSAHQGVIVDALAGEPGTLNPILGPSSFFTRIVTNALFSNLFTVTPAGNLVPVLATTVPTVANGGISTNGLVYTIHLRQGLKWSDGAPFTAEDVWETYHLASNSQVNAVLRSGFSDIKQFQILNPYTVRITLAQPFAPFLSMDWATSQPGIIPWHIFKNIPPGKVNTAAYNHDPTATLGPYEFVSWIPGTSITVKANPHWWGPPVKTKTIKFEIMPNQNSILLAAQARSINVYWSAPIEQLAQLRKIAGAHVFVVKSPTWNHIDFNMHNPLFGSAQVRIALAMALDRPAVLKHIWDGAGTLMAADQPPTSWAYDPHVTPYPYNPRKALSMLEAQGFRYVGSYPSGTLEKNGTPVTLTFVSVAGVPAVQAEERIYQANLRAVGIAVTLKNYPVATLFGSVLPDGRIGSQSGGWDLGEFTWTNRYDPGVVSAFNLAGSSIPDDNFGAFRSHRLDQLFREEQSLVTNSQRRPIFWQIQVLEKQLEPDIFLYSEPQIDAAINMTGYQPNAIEGDTWNCYEWQLRS